MPVHPHTPESLQGKTDQQLQALLANAQRLNAPDIVRLVQEELARRTYGDDLPMEVAAKLEAAVVAYERTQAERKGQRRFRATRTRQALKRHGLRTGVERIVRAGESMGFTMLPFSDTFEAVILEHPDCFSEEAVAISKRRQTSSGQA